MIDGVMGAVVRHPVARFRSGCRADDRHAGKRAGELRQDGADTSGSAHHEQDTVFRGVSRVHAKPVEQQFPGRNCRQGQRRRLGEVQRRGHGPDDALVHGAWRRLRQ
jgi:hypothetical protein